MNGHSQRQTRRALGAAFLAVVLVTSGCATSQIKLSTATTPDVPPEEAARLNPDGTACPFTIARITDLRDSKLLGYVVRRAIHADDFQVWLRNSLIKLNGYTEQPVPLAIDVDLLKAYMQSVSTMKSANIVVRIRFRNGNTLLAEQLYRGADDSMNWSGSESEVQQAFDNALANLMRSIRSGVSNACTKVADAQTR